MSRIFPLVVGFLASCVAGIALAAPLPDKSPGAAVVGDARPIKGWEIFCKAKPIECAVDVSEPKAIVLTKANWASISKVNRDVNREIAPVMDIDHHGEADVWTLAEDGKGDAEDHALLKRYRLTALGLPRRAMRMTVVIDEKGEGHAVLMLITDRGDYVLDSKSKDVDAWHRTGYVFIKRESQDAVAWVSLGGVVAPVTPGSAKP